MGWVEDDWEVGSGKAAVWAAGGSRLRCRDPGGGRAIALVLQLGAKRGDLGGLTSRGASDRVGMRPIAGARRNHVVGEDRLEREESSIVGKDGRRPRKVADVLGENRRHFSTTEWHQIYRKVTPI